VKKEKGDLREISPFVAGSSPTSGTKTFSLEEKLYQKGENYV